MGLPNEECRATLWRFSRSNVAFGCLCVRRNGRLALYLMDISVRKYSLNFSFVFWWLVDVGQVNHGAYRANTGIPILPSRHK